MKSTKKILENNLKEILGRWLITLLILLGLLVWGHLQVRSHKVINLYLSVSSKLGEVISSDPNLGILPLLKL